MERITYEGKQGWMDNNNTFYPKEGYEEVTYDGKRGLLDSKTQEFFADTTPEPTKPAEDKSLLSKLGNRVSDFGGAFVDLAKQAWNGADDPLRPSKRAYGAMAGAANDIVGSTLSSAASAIIPDKVQAYLKDKISEATQTPVGQSIVGGISSTANAYDKFKQMYPEIARDTADVTNILSLLPVVKGAEISKKGVNEILNTGKDIKSLIGNAASIPIKKEIEKSIDVELGNVIKKGVEKTILSSRGKTNDRAVRSFVDKTTTAVKDIVTNKDAIALTNDTGEMVKGKLPASLGDWREATFQREAQVIGKANAINKEMGGQGVTTDLTKLADKLDNSANDVLKIENPEAYEYAKAKAKAYREKGSYTAEEAQQALKELNANFERYLKNPSAKNAIDVVSANNIREELYNSIEKLAGSEYKDLRATYGALKEGEREITKKSIQAAAKSDAPGWIDIISGTEFTAGLLTMNPALMARGGTLEALNLVRKHYRNPNRIVKNMFSEADRLLAEKASIGKFTPKSSVGKSILERENRRMQGQ